MIKTVPFNRLTSLGHVTARLHRLFSRALDQKLAEHGVALGQFPVLLLLWEEQGLTQTEIARRLDFEQPTIANTLKRMIRDGLVRTTPHPTNGRKVLVYLTPAAVDLKVPLTQAAQEINSMVEMRMSSDELDHFFRVLEVMAQELTFILNTDGTHAA